MSYDDEILLIGRLEFIYIDYIKPSTSYLLRKQWDVTIFAKGDMRNMRKSWIFFLVNINGNSMIMLVIKFWIQKRTLEWVNSLM